MKLAAALECLNAAAAELDSPCFTRFRLEEETVMFNVASGGARGVVNLSLHERSRYPRTGALLFADGSDVLLAAVEAASDRIAESAALGAVLTNLAAKLSSAGAALAPEQLERYVAACDGAGGSAQAGGASTSRGHSAGMPNDCGNGCDRGGDEGSDGDASSAGGASDDEDDDNYDLGFAKGDELDDRLLRMRLAWEEKDADRRMRSEPRLHVNEEGPAKAPAGSVGAAPPAGSSYEAQPPGAAPEDKLSTAEAKRRGDKAAAAGRKRGAAAQIFSSAEATRILCNELSSLIREQAEGFAGINADCVDLDVHQWRVQICDISPGCPLEADLAQLRTTHGYGFIELGLRFQADMHPFYPVHLQVSWPPPARAAPLHAQLCPRRVTRTHTWGFVSKRICVPFTWFTCRHTRFTCRHIGPSPPSPLVTLPLARNSRAPIGRAAPAPATPPRAVVRPCPARARQQLSGVHRLRATMRPAGTAAPEPCGWSAPYFNGAPPHPLPRPPCAPLLPCADCIVSPLYFPRYSAHASKAAWPRPSCPTQSSLCKAGTR
jgi:hypothetical protein